MKHLGGPAGNWRWVWALAAVLAAVFFFYPMLLGIPLLDPDEGLHASIAQEMVEGGDWVTPRLLGKPFLDKPILYFWAEALSLRVFGMYEAAVRFPGLMFGLLGAITTGIVGWRMFGRGAGLLAGVLYASMILPTALAQAAAHDVALVPWVNLAILLFWESDRAATRRAALGYTLAIGVLLGLACLTKGLVGVAMVGVAYGLYLLITRRLTAAACLRGAVTLAIGGAIAASWYVAMEIANPGYLHYYFVERHLLGFATGTQNHGDKPWWYYLPILLGGGLPWIGYLSVVVQDGRARRKRAPRDDSHGAMVLLWCWLIGCTLFLSASHSKLVTYIWPVFPAVAILAAVAWKRLIEGTLSAGARRTMAWMFVPVCFAGPILLPGAMLILQDKMSFRFEWTAWVLSLLAATSSAVPAGFWLARRYRATLSAATLSIAAQFAVIMAVVLPYAAETKSAEDLAEHFNRLGKVPYQVLIAEERIGSIVFYLDPDVRSGLREGQLQTVNLAVPLEARPGARVALSPKGVRRVSRYLDLTELEYEEAGRYRLYRASELKPQVPAVAAANAETTMR